MSHLELSTIGKQQTLTTLALPINGSWMSLAVELPETGRGNGCGAAKEPQGISSYSLRWGIAQSLMMLVDESWLLGSNEIERCKSVDLCGQWRYCSLADEY